MRLSPAVTLALALVVTACGGGDDGGAPDPTQPVNKEIDAALGGSVSVAGGSFTLDVPPGALAANTAITVRQLEEAEVPAWVPERLGPVVEILPEGLNFATPVSLRWKLPASAAMADGRLTFAVAGALDGANQRVVPSSTSITHGADATVIIESASHFSLHAAFASSADVDAFAQVELGVAVPTSEVHVDDAWVPAVTLLASQAQSLVVTLAGYSATSDLAVRPFPGGGASSAPLPVTLTANAASALVGPTFVCNAPFSSGVYGVGAAFQQNGLTFEAKQEATISCSVRPGPSVDPDGYTVQPCAELPGTFEPVDAGHTAVVCVDDAACFVSNNLLGTDPLAASTCSAAAKHRVLQITSSGGVTTIGNGDWPIVWSSTGIIGSAQMLMPPASTALRVITRNPANTGFYDINLTYSGTSATIVSAEPFDGPWPVLGVQHHCSTLPVTIGAPSSGVQYGNVCLAQYTPAVGLSLGECFVIGLLSDTPEADSCPSGRSPLAFMYSGEFPYIQTLPTYTFTSISSGSYAGNIASQFTPGVPVTVTIKDTANQVFSIEFQWTIPAGTYTINSVVQPGP